MNKTVILFCILLFNFSRAVSMEKELENISQFSTKIEKWSLKDLELLQTFYKDHQQYHFESKTRDFSELNDEDFKKVILMEELKAAGHLDQIFGTYGFYLHKTGEEKKLVGIIKMFVNFIRIIVNPIARIQLINFLNMKVWI